MTKSTSSTNEVNRAIGSTASFVIRNSDCPVMLVPENVKTGPSVYHGMVIRKASGTITLKGQLNFKQTECLLPSVKGKSVYRIETLKGSVRYVRKAYDPETLSWDLPPEKGEHQLIQINEGEMIYIPVNMDESTGKADRIRIINRSMRSESVFRFRIMTVAQAEAEARAREIEESRPQRKAGSRQKQQRKKVNSQRLKQQKKQGSRLRPRQQKRQEERRKPKQRKRPGGRQKLRRRKRPGDRRKPRRWKKLADSLKLKPQRKPGNRQRQRRP